MSEETTDRFQGEIEKVVDYFRHEYDISYAETVGVLEVVKIGLVVELAVPDDEDEDDE